MSREEEMCLEAILNSLYKKLNMDERVFELSIQTYIKDHPAEIMQIMRLT